MPKIESKPLQTIQRFLDLETDLKKEMQEIVQLAADWCEVPIVIAVLTGEDICYCNAAPEAALPYHSPEHAFARYASAQSEITVIEDILADERFASNFEIAGELPLRFCAGAPLLTHDGHSLGGLCIMDVKSQKLQTAQRHLLGMLARRAVHVMEFEGSLKLLKEQVLITKQSEIKLKSFFESSAACHLLISREMELLAFNKNMLEFLERIHPVRIRAGMKVNEILQGRALEKFTGYFNRAINGERITFERRVDYSGTSIWWHITFEPGYNDEGEIIGISYNAADITERKQAEQRILAQNESLRQVAYMQSHDLRKPVASILGFMEIFSHDDYQAQKEDLQMMEKAVQELDGMIHTIVKLSHYIRW